jgi:hypothetical protein
MARPTHAARDVVTARVHRPALCIFWQQAKSGRET